MKQTTQLNKYLIHPTTFIGLMEIPTEYRYLDTTDKNIEAIFKVVIERFNITGEQIKSSYRGHKVTEARHIFSYLCRELLNTTCTTIAKLLNRDHSSVIYGWNQVKDMSFAYKEYQMKIKRLEAECRQIIGTL